MLGAGAAIGGEPLGIDPAAAAALADWYGVGDAVLGRLVAAAGAEDECDAAAALARALRHRRRNSAPSGAASGANYGFSPGDAEHPEPYAYVGPWSRRGLG